MTKPKSAVLSQALGSVLDRIAAAGRFRDPVLDFELSDDCLTSYPLQAISDEQEGLPYLFETRNYLSMHMAGESVMDVHSVMDCDAPDRLMLSYTEIMMGFLRFVVDPQQIAIIGLGGGSLVKHCYRHLPRTRIDVAEISAEVISLRSRFRLPDDDERLRVLLADGADLIRNAPKRFDAILVDAFGEDGYPSHMGESRFFRQCRAALSPHGVLVVNLCGSGWQTWHRRMRIVFRGNTVLYRCPDGNNIIAFATKQPLPAWARG